jgi:hypothetical protein
MQLTNPTMVSSTITACQGRAEPTRAAAAAAAAMLLLLLPLLAAILPLPVWS